MGERAEDDYGLHSNMVESFGWSDNDFPKRRRLIIIQENEYYALELWWNEELNVVESQWFDANANDQFSVEVNTPYWTEGYDQIAEYFYGVHCDLTKSGASTL
jgi:hypothetical protein